MHIKNFQMKIRICKVYLDVRFVFVVNDRWKCNRCQWLFLRNFIEETSLVIVLVLTSTMRLSGLSLIMSSSFSRILSLVPRVKFPIFTLWLTQRPFSEISYTIEFPVNMIFFSLLASSVWVSFFYFGLGLGLVIFLWV